jgi:hypothetical protein
MPNLYIFDFQYGSCNNDDFFGNILFYSSLQIKQFKIIDRIENFVVYFFLISEENLINYIVVRPMKRAKQNNHPPFF